MLVVMVFINLELDHKIDLELRLLDIRLSMHGITLKFVYPCNGHACKKGGNPRVAASQFSLQPPWLIIIYFP